MGNRQGRIESIDRLVGAFVGEILARDDSVLVVILGDFNALYDSETLATLSEAGGQGLSTNLVVAELPIEERHSYVFEANNQALDHLLVSPALLDALVPGGFDIVHINAEYADQVSGHAPLTSASLCWSPELRRPMMVRFGPGDEAIPRSPCLTRFSHGAIATRRGYCSWDVDHAGWVVTLHSPKEHDFYGKTLEEALAWCLVWLMAPELGVWPFRV